MVKTSVTLPADDLERARELGINVSELVRQALRKRLDDEALDQETEAYAAAFADWDETGFDHLAADGVGTGSDGVNRGDVVLVDLEPVQGAEADKARPAVLVGNDASLRAALQHGRGVVTIVPVTSNPTVRGRMHVALRPTRLNGLRTPSKAQAEQVRSVDVGRVLGGLGRLGPSDLDALDDALRYHLAI